MSDDKFDDRRNLDQHEGETGTTTEENVQPGQDRRQVLKKILLGGGLAAGSAILPDKWAKPVVDVIIAPAHAQTSPTTTGAAPSTPAPTTTPAAPSTPAPTTTPAAPSSPPPV